MKKADYTILIADDEPGMREGLETTLSLEGYRVETAVNGLSASERIEQGGIDLGFIDLKMPDIDGCEVAKRIFTGGTAETVIVIMTAYATVDTAVNAMKLGVADYIKKPFDNEDIISIADRFFQKKHFSDTEQEADAVYQNTYLFINKKMKELASTIEKVKNCKIPILLLGESGTGKEILAKLIHESCSTAEHPFVGINCSAIPPQLMESELFGHEKGAFSDAVSAKPGKFEAAGEGTLFLDEIGDMDVNLQTKLLRVLEEKNFERIGSVTPLSFKARIVASTNRNLQEFIEEKKFRSDLYFRLKGIELTIPPLRERKDEIGPLINHFITIFSKSYAKQNITVSAEAVRKLKEYSWPGNIRELKNSVESAVILNDNGTVLLPQHFRLETEGAPNPILEKKERDTIIEVLEKNQFSRTLAAKELKISRKTLYNKMKKYLIE